MPGRSLYTLFFCFSVFSVFHAQELLSNVIVNFQQVQGSNDQAFISLEKNLKDFINNTSWTGRKLQNFEKIRCNFSIVIGFREGNKYNSSIVVQSVRPAYNSTYESPLININDKDFSFEYVENENLIFNERQFSGKNLIDVISFYIYVILGYDADSFRLNGGQEWFDKALKISQNSQNQRYTAWSVTEGPRTRAQLIDAIIKRENATLREVYYKYHRMGIDNLWQENSSQGKQAVFDALMQLKYYENSFQMNYPFDIFIGTKSNEIFDIFNSGSNAGVNIVELKSLMNIFASKYSENWNRWK
ncbi:MAG: DUF4835 family protein [Bergeyella sp.]|nr:DUF4835 family protein [Bergeyella sp.]